MTSYKPIENMDLYQKATDKTAIYPSDTLLQELSYVALGLNGEAGEIADKVKKIIRDGGGHITPEVRAALIKECGDVLWYVARLAKALAAPLSVVAGTNIYKLEQRAAAGSLQGSGDDR